MRQLKLGKRGGFLQEAGGLREFRMESQLWLDSNVTLSLGGAFCCQSFTDGSKCSNRLLKKKQSLHCLAEFTLLKCWPGLWDVSSRGRGALTKAALEEQKDKGRGAVTQASTQKASCNAWRRSPGIRQSVGVNQCIFFPSKWGHILRPFWISRDPNSDCINMLTSWCPRALGAEMVLPSAEP